MKLFPLFAGALLALQLSSALADDSAVRNQTRAHYLAVIQKPPVPLNAELAPLPAVAGLRKFHLWLAAEAGERVPGYLLLPDAEKFKGPRPVVIALHGTGGTKDNEQIATIVRKAAQAGFIGVAIDGRHHGERITAGGGAAQYNEAIAQAFASGKSHPFFYDTTWDVMRLVDYLVTRKDVDAKRIGLTGISKGGIETYLTAAADPRIAAAVSYIGVQSFKWALENGQWRARIATIQGGFNSAAGQAGKPADSAEFVHAFYERVAPGIDGEFDGPNMLPLVAPRPLLVINSDSDANTPIAGVRMSVDAAKSAYFAAGAADRIQLTIQENTAHKVLPASIDAGIAWFQRWFY